MAGNGDMTYRKRCACGSVARSLYVTECGYVIAARAHPSWGPDGEVGAAGSRPERLVPAGAAPGQPCRRRRTRKAANTASAARASRMPVSTSWSGQKWEAGW